MVARSDVIAAARAMLGTPFHHQGRLPGIGLDCSGLVSSVARTLGLCRGVPDWTDYPRRLRGDAFLAALRARLPEVPVAELAPADIPVFWIRPASGAQHCAIYTERDSIIHVHDNAHGGVIEHDLDEGWRRRIVAVFRYPGLEA